MTLHEKLLAQRKKKLFVLCTDGTFFAVLLNLILKFSTNETWPLSLFFLWTIWAISLSIVSDIWLFSLWCIVRGVRFSVFSFYIYNPWILMWGFTWQRIECHCFFQFFQNFGESRSVLQGPKPRQCKYLITCIPLVKFVKNTCTTYSFVL